MKRLVLDRHGAGFWKDALPLNPKKKKKKRERKAFSDGNVKIITRYKKDCLDLWIPVGKGSGMD